jgi:protein-arginine kinase activator protein McsA
VPAAENVGCECGSTAVTNCDVKADDELVERRKLNMEMRAAVEMEDFEKAAELRDRIRELGA